MRAQLSRASSAARRLTRSPLHALALLVAVALISLWTVLTVWGVRHALAVNRLATGVGGVTFYGADGRPWFRLDERRRDVSLSQIAPSLQHALLATEDRRF
jgi:membrane peptidoglycan carboxypeptidase